MDQSCANCHFHRGAPSDEPYMLGECRFNPPARWFQHVPARDGHFSFTEEYIGWPYTANNAWCGKWEPSYEAALASSVPGTDPQEGT